MNPCKIVKIKCNRFVCAIKDLPNLKLIKITKQNLGREHKRFNGLFVHNQTLCHHCLRYKRVSLLFLL